MESRRGAHNERAATRGLRPAPVPSLSLSSRPVCSVSSTITLRPRLPNAPTHCATALRALRSAGTEPVPAVGEDPDALAARVLALALRDAAAGGWALEWNENAKTLLATAPGAADTAPHAQKTRVRAALVRARDAQLGDPHVQRFIARAETVQTRYSRSASIRDLFLSPETLALDVARVRAAPQQREALAAALVDPYVQLCEADARDEHTGLKLLDVWRYARYTWSLPYETVPGRRMLFLVRDRSRPRHPVIGIFALSSSAVQISVRDRAIGWTPLALAPNDALADLADRNAFDHVLALVREGNPWKAAEWIDTDRRMPVDAPKTVPEPGEAPGETPRPTLDPEDLSPEALVNARLLLLEAEFGVSPAEAVAHLEAEVDRRIKDLYTDDLIAELGDAALLGPTEPVLERLAEIRDGLSLASRILDDPDTESLLDAALSPRFKRKRAVELHKLLKARRTFQQAHQAAPADTARWLLAKSSRRASLKVALREIKKSHVAASVMDVTTCGAVAPYNQLLGGKLAALLAASPDVVKAYRDRYHESQSVIASRMGARPVQRPADLVMLSTTSLYGAGSSQYNRLRVELGKHPDGSPRDLCYHLAGKTLGFGTVHIAADTYNTMKDLLATHGVTESNRFGAGVNVKMRTVGAALMLVGLGGLQQHQQSRLVYLAPIAANWRRVLLGLDDVPVASVGTTDEVVAAWRARYLVPRVLRTAGGHGEPFDLTAQIRDESRVHVNAPPSELGPLFGPHASPASV